MATIFTKLINREIPAHIVAEDEANIAFLDIRPLRPGHTLVVPKLEVDYYFALPDQTLAGLTLFTKRVASALEQVVPCARIGVTIVGLEVPHAHVHLIPMRSETDLSFGNARLKFADAELAALAEKIAAQFKLQPNN